MDSVRSFDRHGPASPQSPVVLSVPHAGRDYPFALRAAIRVPLDALIVLEDRYVDTLALAARGDAIAFVQRRARAWIDLNRGEDERDPRLDDGASPQAQPMLSAKLRSGLGLVPRRTGRGGDIWRHRLSGDEVMARIRRDHRPYHAALAHTLEETRARFGTAILLDVHSMPSLAPPDAARLVFGDRFGRTASARMLDRIAAEATAAGIGHALNTPYAGGHLIARHGAPARGIHAIQIEFDRALYLDGALDAPGTGLAATARLLSRMIAALVDEALGSASAIAAE